MRYVMAQKSDEVRLGYRRIAFYVCISNTMIISEVMVFF